MKFDRLSVLLPCSGLENLRLDRNPDEAEELLSAASALWHPALIAGAKNLPNWLPAAAPPQEIENTLIILPECSRSLLPDDWLDHARAAGAVVLQNVKHRSDMIGAALEYYDVKPASVDPNLVADFLALGFCRFVVELLILKYRYLSNLDQTSFRTSVLAAAQAAIKGDLSAARQQLQASFDRLHEAREHPYPVELRLIDLTLAAPTTLGESLRKQLTDPLPRNLLISAQVLQEMARREPSTLAALIEALKNNHLSIVGGEFSELPLPLLSPEAIDFQLQRGIQLYRQVLRQRPVIFARRRFGLTPLLPQLLAKNGFSSALHFTLDDGQFPADNQSRIQWEGLDGTAIKALGRVPLDAARADSFLRLAQILGEALELDTAPTLVLAHWPGRVSVWYDDLRRICAYSPVLGAFYTLDDYIEQTSLAGRRVRFTADQYRLPYLVQDVAAGRADPISCWVNYYRRRAAWESAQSVHTLAILANRESSSQTACAFAINHHELLAALEDSLNNSPPADPQLDLRLKQNLDAALEQFILSFSRERAPTEGRSASAYPFSRERAPTEGRSASASKQPAPAGYLLVNPCAFSQLLGMELPELSAPPDVAPPVRAAAEKAAVVDLPGMGFAWIGPGSENAALPTHSEKKGWPFKKKTHSLPPLTEKNILRNEFFEVRFDPHTGAIRSISDYRGRHPRLAQQIALRMPDAGEQDPAGQRHYSIMAAEEIRVASAGPPCGEIVSRGKLLDRQGQILAGFQQTTRAWRHSRVLELEIQLDVDQQPGPNPWNSYYACRFAWSDETSELYRSVNLTAQPTEVAHLEAPHFIDVRSEPLRTTILCNGLPFHRRIGLRKLDTLLVVQGEAARRFRLGVGIDLPNALAAALEFLAPRTMYFPAAAPPAKHGWLFHLDRRNVIATHWEPLWSRADAQEASDQERIQGSGFRVQETADNIHPSSLIPHPSSLNPQPPASSLQPIIGFRVHLLETEGRSTQLGLRSFRPVAVARKFVPGNASPADLPIEGDQINITFQAYQMLAVEAYFS